MKATKFNAKDLIPENDNDFPDFSPKSIGEIEFLGKETIRQIVREWRWEARELSKEIRAHRTAASAGQVERRNILILKKRGVDNRIKALLDLEKRAGHKPVLTTARSGDWIAEGDPVIFYCIPCDGFAPRRVGFLRVNS